MICGRCGTEHNDPDKICPRCQYGKPKVHKPIPKWLPWVLGGGGTLLLIGVVVAVILLTYFNADWMHGSWEGSNLAITFNTNDDTFILTNGDNVLNGSFTANRDSFTLKTEDGQEYVYRYERINANKMKLLFTQGNETIRIKVTRMNIDNEEYISEEDELADLE